MKENTERVSEENYFDRLPTELIDSIFSRISEAKCLCICFLVSKSFAAHVVQTRCLRAEIPYPIGQSGGVAVWPPGVINFLKKLSLVESATIRFSLGNPSPNSSQEQPFVWWKYDSFGYIFVCAEGRVDDIPSTLKLDADSLIMEHLCAFKLRLLYLEELVVVLPKLKYISAMDSMKQGNIVLGEESIASIKKEKPSEGGRVKCFCRSYWLAPEVKLSLSGCVLKNVALVLTKKTGACDETITENLVEENEYGEVAMTMMKDPAEFIFPCFGIAEVELPVSRPARWIFDFHSSNVIRMKRYNYICECLSKRSLSTLD